MTQQHWKAIGKVLKTPDGKTVAMFNNAALCKQAAAAMSLTTMSQRTDWLMDQAGYVRKAFESKVV